VKRSPKQTKRRSERARPDRAAAPLRLAIASLPSGERYVPFIRQKLRAAHRLLSPPLRELSLAIVGNAKMAELHGRFMDDPTPTDVLTFELDHDPAGRVVAGEVVVCLPVARTQARERKIKIEHELLLYSLHGMLHLCGFDDRTESAYRAMHRTEDDILTRLGVGKVFSDRRPKRSSGALG
jgi:probable rRNA maturation factor